MKADKMRVSVIVWVFIYIRLYQFHFSTVPRKTLFFRVGTCLTPPPATREFAYPTPFYITKVLETLFSNHFTPSRTRCAILNSNLHRITLPHTLHVRILMRKPTRSRCVRLLTLSGYEASHA